MRRVPAAFAASVLTCALVAAPTVACGGLIGPNGAVNLLRTTTFVGYHDGIEHYVTAFAFAGRRRFVRLHHAPPGHPDAASTRAATGRSSDSSARPSHRARTVRSRPMRRPACRGRRRGPAGDHHRRARHHGAQGRWRRGRCVGHRARLPAAAGRARGARLLRPAQPHLPGRQLRCRCRRRQRGQAIGDGTPVHITIPTSDPWVPLRILSLGKQADDRSTPTSTCSPTGADPAAGRIGRWPVPGSHGPGQRLAAGRPPLGPGHGVGARLRLADEGAGRLARRGPALRPRRRCHGPGAGVTGGGRPGPARRPGRRAAGRGVAVAAGAGARGHASVGGVGRR